MKSRGITPCDSPLRRWHYGGESGIKAVKAKWGEKWNKEWRNVASDVPLQKRLTFTCFSCVQPRQFHKGHQPPSSCRPLAAEMSPVCWIRSIFIKACKETLQYTEQINQWGRWKHLLFVRPQKNPFLIKFLAAQRYCLVAMRSCDTMLFYEQCWGRRAALLGDTLYWRNITLVFLAKPH